MNTQNDQIGVDIASEAFFDFLTEDLNNEVLPSTQRSFTQKMTSVSDLLVSEMMSSGFKSTLMKVIKFSESALSAKALRVSGVQTVNDAETPADLLMFARIVAPTKVELLSIIDAKKSRSTRFADFPTEFAVAIWAFAVTEASVLPEMNTLMKSLEFSSEEVSAAKSLVEAFENSFSGRSARKIARRILLGEVIRSTQGRKKKVAVS